MAVAMTTPSNHNTIVQVQGSECFVMILLLGYITYILHKRILNIDMAT